ncbi:glycosyltransferase family 4 protein [Halorientalis regularis]|uniref:1,4-alpha-glucan branching enzyme n=1 Tax=Halorientalis regularis TaxID=660518 RepID=A0A1G7HGP9_9EURY|nr:glycosyltransferase family 4 protein [Halorientalis regularis]SDE99506.1 1,4-alpha-glucan branching enzyme [Halorientalis regularis]
MTSRTVLVFINTATETSNALEIAASMARETDDIEIRVCSFYPPDTQSFGVGVDSLDASSQLDPMAYVRFVRLVRRIDPDIVHVHPQGTGSIVRLLLSLSDLGLVTTEHNTHDDFGRLKRTVNGFTNVLNDALVANSETTRESFASWERRLLDLADVRVPVIYNGVDLETVRAVGGGENRPELPDGFLIGTAGRLVPQKNQAALLEAAAPLVRAYDSVHVVVVGGGPLLDALERKAHNLGISESVQFTGFLPKRETVHEVLRSLDVFAFPSRYEGFGVAAIEAMALGTPVVANDIPVLREVIGDAGVLVDTSDRNRFGNALERLYENDDERADLADAGRRRATNTFPLSDTVSDYAALYRSVARSLARQ